MRADGINGTVDPETGCAISKEQVKVPTPIKLTLGSLELSGELFDTEASQALAARLPLQISLNRWGDEFYGNVGSPMGNLPGDRQEVLEVGDLAFWEPGNALCLYMGPTPASRGDEPRAAGAAHRIGRVQGDFEAAETLGYSVQASLKVVIQRAAGRGREIQSDL